MEDKLFSIACRRCLLRGRLLLLLGSSWSHGNGTDSRCVALQRKNGSNELLPCKRWKFGVLWLAKLAKALSGGAQQFRRRTRHILGSKHPIGCGPAQAPPSQAPLQHAATRSGAGMRSIYATSPPCSLPDRDGPSRANRTQKSAHFVALTPPRPKSHFKREASICVCFGPP